MANQEHGMQSHKLEGKLRNVLFQFLNVDFKMNDDTSFEKLLTHLSKQGDSTCLQSVCLEWFEHILLLEKPASVVLRFALRLMALFAKNESGFQSLQTTNIISRLCQLIKNDRLENDIPLKVAYIILLSSLLEHNQGCRLIVEFGWWQDVVKLCHESRSIYITRDSQNFITIFLTRLEGRPDICEDTLRHILQPLDNAVHSTLLQVLTLIRHIIETCLIEDNLSVPRIILETFNLRARVRDWLQDTTEISTRSENLSKLLILIYFAIFKTEKIEQIKNEAVAETDFKELENKVFGLFSLLIARKEVLNILKVSVYGHLTWKKIFPCLKSLEPSNYVFENQLMSFQLIPVLINMTTRTVDSECLDMYCDKLFALTNEETQRICYSFREHLLNMDNKQEIAHQAILSILQLEHVIHRDRAVIVFQALMYTLKDFVPNPNLTPGVSSENVTRYPQLLAVVLQSLDSLIRCYSITWRESVETICLFGFTQDLLKDPNLTPKLNVLALKLIQVAITKFMPPNLALLMDTLRGSTINQLGPLLFGKLHSKHWEVRDSALEVLQIVASLANIKFPAFQDHVIENNLCSLTVTIACQDGESYVRASALKCIGQMVKVRAFWDACLSSQDLPAKVMLILQEESEGIVRREAAALMKEIYQHHYFPPSMLGSVYRTMFEAVTSDLYWEVQVNALGFWERVIEQQMCDQGMIDGLFPGVTFSKEHRKIVTLTPHEIKARLCKVLKNLEHLGCLQVLLTALEDCDLKVAQKGVSILEKLATILATYKVIPGSEGDSTPTTSPNCSKPIYDTFGFDNYKTDTAPVPVETLAMDFDFKSPGVMCHETSAQSEGVGANHRVDKRKLNSESRVGSCESGESGLDDYLTKESSDLCAKANNSISETSLYQLGNNEKSQTPIMNKKPMKIFKIDNLGEMNDQTGSIEVNDIGNKNVNTVFKLNNLRDKYDFACVPMEFKVDNVGNGSVGSGSNVFDAKIESHEVKPSNIDGSNGEIIPNYEDDFDAARIYSNRRSVSSEGSVRSPKINNSVANSDVRTRPMTSEQVIDDIVKVTDMNLLASVYRSQMSIADSDPSSVRPSQPSISSEEFLAKLTKLRPNEVLAERDRWLTRCVDDLDSLLDDILACNSNDEASALDCY